MKVKVTTVYVGSVVKIYIIRPKPGPVAKNVTCKAFQLGIEPVSSGLLKRHRFDFQLEGLGVAFFATGPGLGLIMYIFTTLCNFLGWSGHLGHTPP